MAILASLRIVYANTSAASLGQRSFERRAIIKILRDVYFEGT